VPPVLVAVITQDPAVRTVTTPVVEFTVQTEVSPEAKVEDVAVPVPPPPVAETVMPVVAPIVTEVLVEDAV
jgi:hypothetical protein